MTRATAPDDKTHDGADTTASDTIGSINVGYEQSVIAPRGYKIDDVLRAYKKGLLRSRGLAEVSFPSFVCGNPEEVETFVNYLANQLNVPPENISRLELSKDLGFSALLDALFPNGQLNPDIGRAKEQNALVVL